MIQQRSIVKYFVITTLVIMGTCIYSSAKPIPPVVSVLKYEFESTVSEVSGDTGGKINIGDTCNLTFVVVSNSPSGYYSSEYAIRSGLIEFETGYSNVISSGSFIVHNNNYDSSYDAIEIKNLRGPVLDLNGVAVYPPFPLLILSSWSLNPFRDTSLPTTTISATNFPGCNWNFGWGGVRIVRSLNQPLTMARVSDPNAPAPSASAPEETPVIAPVEGGTSKGKPYAGAVFPITGNSSGYAESWRTFVDNILNTSE